MQVTDDVQESVSFGGVDAAVELARIVHNVLDDLSLQVQLSCTVIIRP